LGTGKQIHLINNVSVEILTTERMKPLETIVHQQR
jgi:hypothetical protein